MSEVSIYNTALSATAIYQHFMSSPVTAGALQYFNVKAVGGAVGDGVADDTNAIINTIAACLGNNTTPTTTVRIPLGKLFIPAGKYKITKDINIQSVQGFTLETDGSDVTQLICSGTAFSNGAIFIDGSTRSRYKGLTIIGDGTEQMNEVFWLTYGGTMAATTTGNLIEDIKIRNINFVHGLCGHNSYLGGVQLDNTKIRNCSVAGKQVIGSWSTSGNWQNGITLGSGWPGWINPVTFNANATAYPWLTQGLNLIATGAVSVTRNNYAIYTTPGSPPASITYNLTVAASPAMAAGQLAFLHVMGDNWNTRIDVTDSKGNVWTEIQPSVANSGTVCMRGFVSMLTTALVANDTVSIACASTPTTGSFAVLYAIANAQYKSTYWGNGNSTTAQFNMWSNDSSVVQLVINGMANGTTVPGIGGSWTVVNQNNANGMSSILYFQTFNAPAAWGNAGHRVDGCELSGCANGLNLNATSCAITGCQMNGNRLDLYLWPAMGPITCENIKSYNSGQLFFGGPCAYGVGWPLSLRDITWNSANNLSNVWMDIQGGSNIGDVLIENVRNTSTFVNPVIYFNGNGGIYGPNVTFINLEQNNSISAGSALNYWAGCKQMQIVWLNYKQTNASGPVVNIPHAEYINGVWRGVNAVTPGITNEPNSLLLSSNSARLLFGANNDTNLYRTGANALQTDGSLTAYNGLVSGGAVQSNGLNGAQNASRYVGGTATGPPAGGTFQVGDFVISALGAVWVCTVAGSPGTWANISATKTYWAQTANATVYPSNGSIWQVLNGTLINFTLPVVSDVVVTVIMAGMINVANTAVNAQWRLGMNIDGVTQGAMSYFVGANSGMAQSGSLTATQKVASMAAGAHTAQAVCWWNGTANGAQYYMGTCHAVVSSPSGG